MTETFPGVGGVALALHRLGPKEGSGRPVILLHGLMSSAQTNWVTYGTAAPLAARGFECLMPDLRAHGESAKPRDAAGYPHDVLAGDVAALVAHLGLTDYDLVGYSLGARTAIRSVIAGSTPRRLVLGGMGWEGLTQGSRRRDFFLGAIDAYDTAKPGDPAYFAVQFMKTTDVDRVAVRMLIETFVDTPASAIEAVTVPTLVVCGADDQDNGSAPTLAARMPQAELVTIPGNHMSAVTKPDLGSAIADFLLDRT